MRHFRRRKSTAGLEGCAKAIVASWSVSVKSEFIPCLFCVFVSFFCQFSFLVFMEHEWSYLHLQLLVVIISVENNQLITQRLSQDGIRPRIVGIRTRLIVLSIDTIFEILEWTSWLPLRQFSRKMIAGALSPRISTIVRKDETIMLLPTIKRKSPRRRRRFKIPPRRRWKKKIRLRKDKSKCSFSFFLAFCCRCCIALEKLPLLLLFLRTASWPSKWHKYRPIAPRQLWFNLSSPRIW